MARFTPSEASNLLLQSANREFAEVFAHGSLVVEIYRPANGVDRQTPHTRDELYTIISGSGQFLNGTHSHPFGPGDVLFVPAGVEHRFFDFSDDFATWVFFYGPKGGERQQNRG